MTLGTACALTGSVLVATAAVIYLYDIFRGGTRPHRVSWTVWTLIGVLGTSATVIAGAGFGAGPAVIYVVLGVAIVALSFTKRYGKPGGQPSDYVIGAFAIVMIVLWRAASLPSLAAVAAAIVADLAVSLLTLRESQFQ